MTGINARAGVVWLAALRSYLLFVIPANLIWEIAHLPLYTIWLEPLSSKAFAVFHCTLGDALIAIATLVLAIVAFGSSAWPLDKRSFRTVAVATIVAAVGYTTFSEWLNVSVRRGWAYSELMPTIPWIGTGVSPLLQWIVLPAIGFMIMRLVALRSAHVAK
nr:hypothetical protein [Nitrosomonas nitrosa]